MDFTITKAQLSDTAYQQEYGLPRLVSFEFGQLPLEKAQRLLDDPVEFRIVAREFWLAHGGKNGGMSRDELAEVCVQIFEQLGEWEEWTAHPTEEQLDEVFHQTDVNGTGLIEFEEFHDAARRVLTKIRHSKSARMLANQSKLPKLPIPKLEDTVARYASAISWFPSVEKREDEVREMLEELRGPKGQAIQGALQQYAQDKYSYVEEFWAAMYGRMRNPLAVHVSPAVLFLQNKKVAFNRPLFKAARFTALLMGMADAMSLHLLDPDYVRGVPLCMWEYQLLFARTRVPDETCDYNVVTAPLAITETEYAGIQQIRRSPRHVMVLKQNRIFLIDAYHPDGSALSAMEFLSEYEKIDMICRDRVVGPALGALTANDRTTWARDRAHLIECSERNADNIAKMDSAIMTVSLDSLTPDPTSSTALAWSLHGDGRNRWFDNTPAFAVAANGVCGMVFEHSACDAWPYIRALVQLSRELHDETWEEQPRQHVIATRVTKERVEELKFDLDEKMHQSIAAAEESVDKLIARTAVRYLTFTKFGKKGIVKHNVSPDAFLQVALILAFYVAKGYFPNTYSAGGTKQFLHGRTECVRSSTPAMLAYVQAHVKYFGIEPGETSSDEQRRIPTWAERVEMNKLLHAAINVHVGKMIEAKFGQGCDRHMFALRCIAGSGQVPQEVIPKIFQDPLFGESMTFNLSTSNVPASPYSLSQVFGPVTDDGFGVCYSVYNGHLTFGVTCWKNPQTGESSIDPFRNHLEQAILDIEGVVLPAIPWFDRVKAKLATRYAMLAMLLTHKLGWLMRVPVIGTLLRYTPVVNKMLTYKPFNVAT